MVLILTSVVGRCFNDHSHHHSHMRHRGLLCCCAAVLLSQVTIEWDDDEAYDLASATPALGRSLSAKPQVPFAALEIRNADRPASMQVRPPPPPNQPCLVQQLSARLPGRLRVCHARCVRVCVCLCIDLSSPC
jgi:hypothetical protein